MVLYSTQSHIIAYYNTLYFWETFKTGINMHTSSMQCGVWKEYKVPSQEEQFQKFLSLLEYVSANSPFYKQKFLQQNVDMGAIKVLDDISMLPFTYKEELREAYPLGLQAAPEEKVVRIHSSSGTTGKTRYHSLYAERC